MKESELTNRLDSLEKRMAAAERENGELKKRILEVEKKLDKAPEPKKPKRILRARNK